MFKKFLGLFKRKPLVIDCDNAMPIYNAKAKDVLMDLFAEKITKEEAINRLIHLEIEIKELIKKNNPTGEKLFRWLGVGLMIENSKELVRNY